MRGVIAHAQGSPCPTLVLPGDELPDEEPRLTCALRAVREALPPAERDQVLKFALVSPARDRRHDLGYRFVQAIPGHDPEFEFRGSCGHSILAAVVGAARLGIVEGRRAPLMPGGQTRVRVRNNGDTVVCTVEAATDGHTVFTVHFEQPQAPVLRDLLLFGEPVTHVAYGGVQARLSGVTLGNPYVFVDARAMGWGDHTALFTGGDALFDVLSAIRRGAEQRLGWPPGAFPKVAAVTATADGGLAARAISVPTWHPTLALTGAACLAAAAAISGSVVADLVPRPSRPLTIITPGGRTVVCAATTGRGLGDRLRWVALSRKEVRFVRDIELTGAHSASVSAGRYGR